jgi:hypothetical protein
MRTCAGRNVTLLPRFRCACRQLCLICHIMNARALGAATAALFLMSCCHTSVSAVSITLPSSLPSSSNVIRDNFLGVSLEFNVLDFLSKTQEISHSLGSPLMTHVLIILVGPSPDNILTPMKNYLTNLRSRISNNLRLRVGGNSLDGSIYNRNATKMISFSLAPAEGRIANVPIIYGPQILTTLNVRPCGAEYITPCPDSGADHFSHVYDRPSRLATGC